MLGIPRPDFPEPPAEAIDTEQSTPAAAESDAPAEPATPSNRTRPRARVRYDSANEPLPMIHRRKKALRGLALLVLLAAAWLGYRLLTLNG